MADPLVRDVPEDVVPSADDLRRFAARFPDLTDPDVMERAWE